MPLLISDTNIIIDLEVGGIVEQMFHLPFEFMVPDHLYAQELSDQHANLIDLGLLIGELNSESMLYVSKIIQKLRGPSFIDCLALGLAKQQNCTLLTGDGALRRLATLEEVEVKGTIWLVEQMIVNKIITKKHANKSFELMKVNNSRLPWAKVYEMLNKL